MKEKLIKWMAAPLFLVFFTGTAWSHSVWMDISGEQTAATGDTVTINIYAHADADDYLSMYAVSIGFDDAALGGELTYDSYDLNLSGFVADSFFFPGTYEQSGSGANNGKSWVYDIGAFAADYQNMVSDGVAMAAGSDLLLFSISFIYTSSETVWSGDDVWIEFRPENNGGLYWSGAFEPDTDIDPLRSAADLAAPVPVPGAIWLMGFGLAGLAGICRRTEKKELSNETASY